MLLLRRRMMLLQIFDSVVKPLYVKKKTRHRKTAIKTKTKKRWKTMENVFASQPSISPERHCHQPPVSSAAETNQKGRRLILLIVIVIVIIIIHIILIIITSSSANCQLPTAPKTCCQSSRLTCRSGCSGKKPSGACCAVPVGSMAETPWSARTPATIDRGPRTSCCPAETNVMFHHVPGSPSETSVNELLQLS